MRRAAAKIGPALMPLLFSVKRADIAAQSGYQEAEKLEMLAHIEEIYRDIRSALSASIAAMLCRICSPTQ